MTLNLTGKHLIAGEWVEGSTTFTSSPASGESHTFFAGSAALVDRAMKAAEEAFVTYGYSSREERAKFLEAIAEQIDARGDEITKIGSQETGLPEARLVGERGRTTGQLRLFATHILKGDYLDRRHDAALPDRQPLPRPDIRLMQRPIGPVGVFGASNFPLAFSTAGGDTASALAAGCPVVVKGHEAHPGTSEIVAQAIAAAIKSCGIHPGVFSLIQGGNRETGEAICLHPLTRAVGFTGSLRGGRALFDLCVRREEPIPFFGELGSVNPMFLLPAAVSARGETIAKGWAGSLTMGAGQFCTNPGIAVVKEGAEADAFLETAKTALAATNAQTMLTDGIANAYREGAKRIEATEGVQSVLTTTCDLRNATPYLFATTGENWLANHVLGEEVFGPLGVLVTVKDEAEMVHIAESLVGQLTTTLQMDDADAPIARKLLPILERKSGRVLANGFPTGVEVCDAMVHGGPYPATTNFGATSVGTMAIRRFMRPVSYQNIPVALLPEDLQ
ncbi:aldehyde dehydrogenase (NADP(+)) [Allorhizobium taibaishanense]|uniref:2,5-dioxovalerate dehydrogenase n=1 Tax=Allorhizobium taibaishanense TaxID=887144 RepID=A0A1Q9A5A1_9HYPH|nr:aldehyde dehydrogenase (NADP(+)) [Allorhizobium taibaishanense]MBB4006864.1 NADP-dependent aldehyde dehydrogenase [Allorhizobium taibaishanense]OLP49744.1 2,5-dioxovalerate dehydrogenase [Allorhizobium taibaishanense]